MKILDCAQRSEEWHLLRGGLLTGSCADAILAVRKRGSGELQCRIDLRRRLVAERLTGQPIQDITNKPDYMTRGEDCEPIAVAAYEARTGQLVEPVGFVLHDTLQAGCSPDGQIADFTGILEVKCPKSTTHLEYLQAGILPDDYRGQILHNLWITGAQWCDFVSFDDRYDDELELFIVRVERDEAQIGSYELLVRQFLAEVERDVDAIRHRELAGAVA
jgi:putative phage-type endonuclease